MAIFLWMLNMMAVLGSLNASDGSISGFLLAMNPSGNPINGLRVAIVLCSWFSSNHAEAAWMIMARNALKGLLVEARRMLMILGEGVVPSRPVLMVARVAPRSRFSLDFGDVAAPAYSRWLGTSAKSGGQIVDFDPPTR